MDRINHLTDAIAKEFLQLLPHQHKTQRDNLALLIATILDVRSANLMDLGAGLPRAAERIDMRARIWRVLMNPSVVPDNVLAPFAGEVIQRLADAKQLIVLIMDQSKINDRHQVLMPALRHGERALPVLWRVEATKGSIGFKTQKELLEAVVGILPKDAQEGCATLREQSARCSLSPLWTAQTDA